MVFDIRVGIESNDDKKLIRRDAVRSISFRGDCILMLSSNRGDYKLPGGGIENGESSIEALHREIEEETGYRNVKVVSKIGRYLERKVDKYDSSCIFEMNSEYFLCEVIGDAMKPNLTESEIALGMKPVWINLDEVITANEEFFIRNRDKDLWTSRELKVLKIIKDEQKKLREMY